MWPFHPSSSADELPGAHDRPAASTRAAEKCDNADKVPGEHTEQADAKEVYFPGITGWPNERLSIPFVMRAPFLLATSFVVGFSLGAARGGPIAAFRYRAENAHRLPTTQTGWFLYHKSKNYHSIVGGVKEGVKFGGVLAAWAGLFMACEEVIDQSRAKMFTPQIHIDDSRDVLDKQEQQYAYRDAASTVVAAMTTAGVYSWKRGLDAYTTARTARLALKYSLIYGLVQDAAATLRGQRPAYIDWIARHTWERRHRVDDS